MTVQGDDPSLFPSMINQGSVVPPPVEALSSVVLVGELAPIAPDAPSSEKFEVNAMPTTRSPVVVPVNVVRGVTLVPPDCCVKFEARTLAASVAGYSNIATSANPDELACPVTAKDDPPVTPNAPQSSKGVPLPELPDLILE